MEIFNTPERRVFALSFLTLVLELVLIRWYASNVFHLGFFSNFVLLSCFLGIGIGFLITDRDYDFFAHSTKFLFFTMAGVLLFRVKLAVPTDGSLVFIAEEVTESNIIPVPLFLAGLFFGTVATFAAISQETGRAFKQLPTLRAYTFDIAGSLAGIITFTVMSFFSIPSLVWFLLAAVIWGMLSTKKTLKSGAALALIGIVFLSTNADTYFHLKEVKWSPYQLVTLMDSEHEDQYYIHVNRIIHQTVHPLSHFHEPVREVPYDLASAKKEVLVIGAGSGVDVEIALENGAGHVDAVEIDPEIAGLAKKYNKDQPYSDPRVTLHLTDGRHFLETTDKKYDVIVLALPDSLTLLSNQSNVRLESFLFTLDAFKTVKKRLKPDGVFSMYNFYRSESIVHRLSRSLEVVFERKPNVIMKDGNFAVLSVGANVQSTEMTIDESVVKDLPTDDWPFLYLIRKHIPVLYLIPIILILLISAGSMIFLRRKGSGPEAFSLAFFTLGAAFLLLETKSIIQFSLLFGSTWVVNSLVFAGVLTMVLIANLLVAKLKPKSFVVWFLLLLVSLFVQWWFQPSDLVQIVNPVVRYCAAILINFTPIFFANVIFAGIFVQSESSTNSFGWNLLGAMFGGTLEYAALALGYRDMAFIVAVFYIIALLSFVFVSRKSDSGPTKASDGE